MSERASLARHSSERLAARRRKHRRRTFYALGISFFLVLGGLLYGLWQPSVRISHIAVFGADTSLATLTQEALQGNYFGLVPRDSTFFLPTARIRTDLLAAYPGIAAVSIFRNGFNGLSIKVDDRTPLARWCGFSSASSSPEDSPLKEALMTVPPDCYLFDPNGFVYATATEPFPSSVAASSSVPIATSTNPDKTLSPFVLFDGLKGDTASPVGATLEDASHIAEVFDFARKIGSLGPQVGSIVIRGAEVDLFLVNPASGATTGPRITYLLGDEQNALTALVSAKGQLNLSDPRLQYVDLRFSGRIYVKRN